jgi:hypothetical protein
MNANPAPRYRFSHHDRIQIHGIAYVGNRCDRHGYTLRRADDMEVAEAFGFEEVHEWLQSGEMVHEPDFFRAGAAQILLVRPIAFPADVSTLRRLVGEIVRNHAELEADPSIDADEFLHRLCHASGGAFGLAVCLTRDAVAQTLRQNEPSVTAQHFAAAYADVAPTKAPNLFSAADWAGIRTWYRNAEEE